MPHPSRSPGPLPAIAFLAALAAALPATGEDGYDLWLRYPPLEGAALEALRAHATAVVALSDSPTGRLVRDELQRGLGGLTGTEVPARPSLAPGSVLAGTPGTSPRIAALAWDARLDALGPEGFVLRSLEIGGTPVTVLASSSERGVLYGAFHLLRLIQTGHDPGHLDVAERPRIRRRMLDHWDNLDGSIERGYAGTSLWKWDELPGRVAPRIADYARANASLGINGTVLNNVNASPKMLTRPYLEKAAAIADALRPWGLRVYLSANFSSPRILGGLDTSDPLDPAVIAWWEAKADEVYALIPDFGGFLVKANSEGQPGPQDFGRTHGQGANALARALAPHGGVVMWRAFVYDADVDPDRVKRAWLEFVPLDGTLEDNVFVQVKNGPLDFQPREPFHPLFGAVPRTKLIAELQVTQEYLGHSNHLVYLAPLWREFLDSDTFAKGPGSLVSEVVDGSLDGHTDTGMAGVANTGSDRNWTGHHFGQANWYAYGRLAWNPELSAEAIADEWIPMTWGRDPALAGAIRSIMLESREAIVRYSMPLGLHHLIGGDHYAPMPENPDPRRADWSALYYHRADASGIGFDRTTSGSDALAQYHQPLPQRWGDPATIPEQYLLWFHRLPWNHRMKSGRTLWEELVHEYVTGAEQARDLLERWQALRGRVDDERFEQVLAKLRIQAGDAAAWRDHCLGYFQGFSGGPLPEVAAETPAAR
jgi:alpha-glucuronidase